MYSLCSFHLAASAADEAWHWPKPEDSPQVQHTLCTVYCSLSFSLSLSVSLTSSLSTLPVLGSLQLLFVSVMGGGGWRGILATLCSMTMQ